MPTHAPYIGSFQQESGRDSYRGADPKELARRLPVGRSFDYKLRLSMKGHVDISITLEQVILHVHAYSS